MLNYVYYNELSLDDENNFTMNITENNAIHSNKFTTGEKHLLSTWRLKPKKEAHIKNGMIMIK